MKVIPGCVELPIFEKHTFYMLESDVWVVALLLLIFLLSLWRKRLALYLFLATVSFEIFLTAEVQGFTLRFAYVPAFALFLRCLCEKGFHPGKYVNKGPAHLPMLAYLLICLISIGYSFNVKRSMGYCLWLLFDMACIYFVLQNVLEDRSSLTTGIRAFLCGITLAALFGLYQYGAGALGAKAPLVTQKGYHGLLRINGFSGAPPFYAVYLMTGFPLLAVLWLRPDRILPAWLLEILFYLLSAVLFLSTSRTAWLGWLLTLPALLVAHRLIPGKRRPAAIVRLVTVSLVIFALLAYLGSYPGFRKGIRKMTTEVGAVKSFRRDLPPKISSTTERVFILLEGIRVIRDNPLKGIGLGAYGTYTRWAVKNRPDRYDPRIGADVPHNLWIEVWAETGIAGLAAALALVLSLLLRGLKVARTDPEGDLGPVTIGLSLSAVLTFFVTMQFVQTFMRPDCWVLLGLLAATIRLGGGSQPGATGKDWGGGETGGGGEMKSNGEAGNMGEAGRGSEAGSDSET
jgi:O-antigen ligase